jgi:hypothetical protein
MSKIQLVSDVLYVDWQDSISVKYIENGNRK